MIDKQLFILFFCLATFVLGMLMIFLKNLVHIAFSFLGVLLCIAALFVLANAEFVAVTQLLIYVGGILILFLFGTMLTANYTIMKTKKYNFFDAIVFLIFVGIFIGMILVFLPYVGYQKEVYSIFTRSSELNIQQIGIELITKYAILFELSGILLLIALISAAFIASKKPKSI